MRTALWLTSLSLLLFINTASAQTTGFTYQGKLTNSGTPANGNYDMQFKLFDAVSGGLQKGGTLIFDGAGMNPPSVSVTNGIFKVTLDFGTCAPVSSCFEDGPRFLEIAVRPSGGGAYTTLSPRQEITPTPFALKTSGFTLNGRYDDIGLSASNTFAGDLAGAQTTPHPDPLFAQGKLNSFFGGGAGQANTSGFYNSFFGGQAGMANVTGDQNAFFGAFAGASNTTGNANTFIGDIAGSQNVSGIFNTFVGWAANIPNLAPFDGIGNTLLGANSKSALSAINSTAIGYRATVTQSNSLVLGSINGINGGTDTNVGIGTTAPTERLHVVGNGLFTGNLTVTGTITGSLPAGSGSYIQNQNATTQAGDFKLTGSGTVGGTLTGSVINATTQYNIVSPALGSSIRLLGISGTGDTNTFLGRNAAAANPTGSFNSFFGNGAGQSTADGGNNSFFGSGAGSVNVSGNDNAFFGRNAGNANTASDNTFFGSFAGAANVGGTANAFFGKEAGRNNTGDAFGGANNNSFFGYQAGLSNTVGFDNSLFGYQAGRLSSTAGANAFFGSRAGWFNTGSSNTFLGNSAGQQNTSGAANVYVGTQSGRNSSTGSNNTFIGVDAGYLNANPSNADNNILIGAHARLNPGVSNGTAIGANSSVTLSDSVILGNNANVGIGTTAPSSKLQIIDASNTGLRVQTNATGGTVASFGGFGEFQIDASGTVAGRFLVTENGNVGIGTAAPNDKLEVNGILRVNSLGSAGGTTLCRNGSNQISSCSSSIRYKNNIAPLLSDRSLINHLRPVTFDWRQSGEHDLGLVAEEVAKVEPLLVTHNDKGEIEGVKYDRIGVLMINVVKEQQTQIDSQQRQIENQQRLIEHQQQQLEALKELVCSSHRKHKSCK